MKRYINTIWKAILGVVKISTGTLILLISTLSVILYNLSRWALNTWANLSMDEIIFHLKVPVEGTNEELIADGVNACLPAGILVFIAVLVILVGVKKRKKLKFLVLLTVLVSSLGTIANAADYVWTGLDLADYIESQKNNSDFIKDNYVDPRTVEITFPEQKRNLIYIFLESMETTYMSKEEGGAFEENIIPELTELAKNNISFSNSEQIGKGYPTTGATWTMGGIFAQTSGLPLKIPISNNSMSEQKEFLPNIVNLGDVLDGAGYNQEFIIGSDAVFGGRKNYFEQHGNYEIWDYVRAKREERIHPDYYVWWGYEDARLFEFAKEQILELAEQDEPFNATVLTVDTHFEDGWVCQLCQNEYDDRYKNVFSCSSRQVADFVQWIQQQDFYQNTTIVLAGDHLTMDSDFCANISEEYNRSIYTAIINPFSMPFNATKREFSTMDMFPTTLGSLGVAIEGDRLGLGTNLFGNKETLVEKIGIESLNKELDKKSAFFENFTKEIQEEIQ